MVSWMVERWGEQWTVKHTQAGVDKLSTKHLKLVDARGEVRARWVSYLSSSVHTLGKLELELGEGEGEGEEWVEWCLALMVGIAEREKREKRRRGAAAGG